MTMRLLLVSKMANTYTGLIVTLSFFLLELMALEHGPSKGHRPSGLKHRWLYVLASQRSYHCLIDALHDNNAGQGICLSDLGDLRVLEIIEYCRMAIVPQAKEATGECNGCVEVDREGAMLQCTKLMTSCGQGNIVV